MSVSGVAEREGLSIGAVGGESSSAAGGVRAPGVEIPDQLSDHNYDGIQEYDNPTPGWWHVIFLASVVFSVGYFIYWNMDEKKPTIQDDWAEVKLAEDTRALAKLEGVTGDEAGLLKLMGDKEKLSLGAGIFYQAGCTRCHGANAEGAVGPNLTDEVFIHVKRIEDIVSVIKEGRNNGAMPAHPQLPDKQVAVISAYVASLRGKNVPGPRGPEGVAIPPWPAAAK